MNFIASNQSKLIDFLIEKLFQPVVFLNPNCIKFAC